MKKLLLDNLVEISENGIQVKTSDNGALCFLSNWSDQGKNPFFMIQYIMILIYVLIYFS